MNKSYTIAGIRSEVFKTLDEYSCNGENHEIFSGGTGDIDKRFISALNSSIKLVECALSRTHKNMTVSFFNPLRLACISDFEVLSDIKNINIPLGSGSLSFDFSGKGGIGFLDEDGNEKGKTVLCSDFGVFKNIKLFVPEGAVGIYFDAESGLVIKALSFYDAASLHGCDEEKFLPDGKKLYCGFSKRCAEICGVSGKRYGRITEVPDDIFDFGDGYICCDEKYAGTYTVEYFEYPREYSESDGEDTVLELSPMAYTAVVYATAANLCEREDGELYSKLTYKYREMLANTYPIENYRRKNSFFSGGLFGRRGRHVFRR